MLAAAAAAVTVPSWQQWLPPPGPQQTAASPHCAAPSRLQRRRGHKPDSMALSCFACACRCLCCVPSPGGRTVVRAARLPCLFGLHHPTVCCTRTPCDRPWLELRLCRSRSRNSPSCPALSSTQSGLQVQSRDSNGPRRWAPKECCRPSAMHCRVCCCLVCRLQVPDCCW